MSDYACPQCGGDLDDSCPDGLSCTSCKKWYPAYVVQQWIEDDFIETVKQQDYESLDDGEDDPDLEDPDQDG